MSAQGTWLAAGAILLGCGSGSTPATSPDAGADARERDTGTKMSEAAPPPESNVVPIVVNSGPPTTCGAEFFDVAFISVELCVPGTSDCQTIDYVDVDTGSTGLRVLSSALKTALPAEHSPTGGTLAECQGFGGGFTWGSIRLADIKIGGRVAAKVPIQVVGDLALSTAPSVCSEAGPPETSPATLGGLALLGVNPMLADCGTSCTNPAYFSCNGSDCSSLTPPVADQVKNPLALFDTDNNGVVFQFPTVPLAGARTVTGSLIFGIGTASNNALGATKILTLSDDFYFTTVYKGRSFAMSYVDSGTNSFVFDDESIPDCSESSIGSGEFCPPSTLSLTAVNTGQNMISASASFEVANADTLFANSSLTAFDDVAAPSPGSPSFAWGLPFFIGRTIFFAFDGAETPGGKGPYVAY
jgi:hypothetical protein